MESSKAALERANSEQALDFAITLDGFENLRVNTQQTRHAPRIWVGEINAKFHELEQGDDVYHWSKVWFPNFKDEIVYEKGDQQFRRLKVIWGGI